MRIVGIVTELKLAPGLYGRARHAETRAASRMWTALHKSIPQEEPVEPAGASTSGASAKKARRDFVVDVAEAALSIGVVGLPGAGVFMPALPWPALLRRLFERQPDENLERIENPEPIDPALALPAAKRSIVISAPLLDGKFNDFDAPVFHGLFESSRQLATLASAEGGHVDFEIVDQATANRHYTRVGGAAFSTGLHRVRLTC
jgi:hypothetical protein